MNFPLTVLSPAGIGYDGNVSYCYIPSSNGPIGVLPSHTPLIARISDKGGVLRFADDNGRIHFFAIKSGAAEVKKEKTIIIASFANEAPSLDEAKALLEATSKTESEEKADNDVKLAEGLSHKKI